MDSLTKPPIQVGTNAIAASSALEHLLVGEEGRLALVYLGKGLRCKCLCGETFNTCPALERHLTQCQSIVGLVQSNELSRYRCAKCMVFLSTMAKVSAHYRVCTGSEESTPDNSTSNEQSSPVRTELVQCRYCSSGFTTVTGRGLHEKARHSALISAAAPKDKSPQWTDAEHDLLIEAEAKMRIEHSLEDRRVIRNFPHNDWIYAYMKANLPGFSRTWASVKARRCHGDAAGFFASVMERKRIMLASTAGPSASQCSLASTTNQDCNLDDGEGSSTLNDQCSCNGDLRAAIDSHLSSLELESSKVHNYLSGILERLDAYENSHFSRTMRINGADRSSNTQTGKTSSEESTRSQQQGCYGGKKFKERVAKVAIARQIFDTQGHKRCLQHLRNPIEGGLCNQDTVRLFKTVFEDNSEGDEGDTAPYLGKSTLGESHAIHKPIDSTEITTQLRRLPKNTAPGPDGIRAEELHAIRAPDLACLFNIFLLHGDVPSALKVNKTTMIPKCENPAVGDWRPITVASIVDRLFAKVLEARLSRAVRLDANQRGFMQSLDGCGENITAYSGALRYSRTTSNPLVIVSIDLAKAFDSVKYSTIKRALSRLGVDERSVNLLMNLCHGHTTIIKHKDGSESVELRKGVRQGWPLSPVLFLCVVDELLCQLNPADGFQVKSPSLEKATLTGLAFADDVILYSSNRHGMQKHLDKVVSWCSDRGMRINPSKSTVLHLRRAPKTKRVLLAPLEFSIDGVQIPQVSDSFERVLGVHMHHTGKVNHGFDSFDRDLELVCNSKLRPTQKVSMIKNCLIPMIKYRLVYGFANGMALTQVDKVVRKAIRRAYHLPQYLMSEVMHAPTSQGGLGIPKLAESVPIAQARLTNRMLSSSNASTRILADTRSQQQLSRSHSDFIGVQRIDGALLESLQKHLQDQRTSKFLNSVQGAGWSLFTKAPRLVLDNPRSRRWTERDAIDYTKMRANVLMTRELTARTVARGQNIDVSCRGCKSAVETQMHILSKCPSTQADRVARHDSVCAYLMRRLQKAKTSLQTEPLGSRVHREFRVMMQPGEVSGVVTASELRPDLAVILDDKIVVIEVSVVYEAEKGTNDNSLKLVRRDKLTKYEPLRRVLAARFERPCQVHTLIVGCRGGWLASNNKVFQGLGVPFSELDQNSCVERAVRGSLITFRRFHARTLEPLRRHKRS